MAKAMKQFHDPDLSLWQSAVDQMVAERTGGGGHARDVNSPVPVARPDQGNTFVAAANVVAEHVDQSGEPLPVPVDLQSAAARGIGDTARFCASTAFQLARARLTGNAQEVERLERQLGRMGVCDPGWLKVVDTYIQFKASGAAIPYRRHQSQNDFVIDGRLPSECRVALVADWGTGDDGAKFLLRQIADKKPQVVIHLGDVYYSGTEHEFQNYFYKIWQQTFGLEPVAWGGKPSRPSTPATFTMSGNHDYYAGGAPYYTAVDMLGQPASYFCLRNDNWQFIALDTGLHDSNPVKKNVTFLEDTEVEWLKDKVARAEGRNTVLLSHHQLFTTFESIGDEGNRVNRTLLGQVQDVLPRTTAWFWGHEHNLVIYDRFLGVLGRCIGHGAFPVSVGELGQPDPQVPIEKVALSPDSENALFQHGYVILDLNGAEAAATYYQFNSDTREEAVVHREKLGSRAAVSAP